MKVGEKDLKVSKLNGRYATANIASEFEAAHLAKFDPAQRIRAPRTARGLDHIQALVVVARAAVLWVSPPPGQYCESGRRCA